MGDRTAHACPEEARIFHEWLSGESRDKLVAGLVLSGLTDAQFDYAVLHYGDGYSLSYIATLRGRTLHSARMGVSRATIRLLRVLNLVKTIRGEGV